MMNAFQKAGGILLILIGIVIGIFTIMYSLDLYPNNCRLLPAPLYTRCMDLEGLAPSLNIHPSVITKPYTINFYVNAPDETPAEDIIYFETDKESFRMDKIKENVWALNLTRFEPLNYRYNRDNLGYISSEELNSTASGFRTVKFEAKEKNQKDVVSKWRYISEEKPRYININPSSPFNASFQKGFAIAEYWWPAFVPLINKTNERIKQDNGNWIMLTVNDEYSQTMPLPKLKQRSDSYTSDELKAHIQASKSAGLKVMLKVKLCCNSPPVQKYSEDWWAAWFGETEGVMKKYAVISRELGVDAILIDYSYDYSLPGEVYASRDAGKRWEGVIQKIRGSYTGLLGLSTFVTDDYKDAAPQPYGVRRMSQYVDFIGIDALGGICGENINSQESLDKNAGVFAEKIASFARGCAKNAVLSVNYPSVSGACGGIKKIPPNTAGLQPWESENPNLSFGGNEQAMIYESYLKSISNVTEISGFYSAGYTMESFPDAYDYSVRGKEAENVLKAWYSA